MTTQLHIQISRVDPATADVPLPGYATEGAAGMDICAAVPHDVVLHARQTALIPTGFAIALPAGFEAQVRPRSGLAAKHSISIMNAPGTIDPDYRGEVKVILTNFGETDFVVRRGDRIAQMIIAPFVRAVWDETPVLDATLRGEGGFGHTGR